MFKDLIRVVVGALFLCSTYSFSYQCNPTSRGNYPGCPFDAEWVRINDGLTLSPVSKKNKVALLSQYNGAYQLCEHKGTNVLAGYSKYHDGMVYILDGDTLLDGQPMDRALLADVISGKVTLRTRPAPNCPPKTIQTSP